jgi:hypothetical protein
MSVEFREDKNILIYFYFCRLCLSPRLISPCETVLLLSDVQNKFVFDVDHQSAREKSEKIRKK